MRDPIRDRCLYVLAHARRALVVEVTLHPKIGPTRTFSKVIVDRYDVTDAFRTLRKFKMVKYGTSRPIRPAERTFFRERMLRPAYTVHDVIVTDRGRLLLEETIWSAAPAAKEMETKRGEDCKEGGVRKRLVRRHSKDRRSR